MRMATLLCLLVLTACVVDPVDPGDPIGEGCAQPDDLIATMGIPTRLFSAGAAVVDMAEGTPILGATVDVRCLRTCAVAACLDVDGRSSCSPATACTAGAALRLYVKACAIVGADQKVGIRAGAGGGASVDSALLAMRVLPDPL